MATDPWAEHPGRESHPGKGKGKQPPTPPVPEPAATGALIVLTALLTVSVVRWRTARMRRSVTHPG